MGNPGEVTTQLDKQESLGTVRPCQLKPRSLGGKIDTRDYYRLWDHFRLTRRARRMSYERLTWDLVLENVDLSVKQVRNQDRRPLIFIRYCEQDPAFLPAMINIFGRPETEDK